MAMQRQIDDLESEMARQRGAGASPTANFADMLGGAPASGSGWVAPGGQTIVGREPTADENEHQRLEVEQRQRTAGPADWRTGMDPAVLADMERFLPGLRSMQGPGGFQGSIGYSAPVGFA